jgi:hypothetical protein
MYRCVVVDVKEKQKWAVAKPTVLQQPILRKSEKV